MQHTYTCTKWLLMAGAEQQLPQRAADLTAELAEAKEKVAKVEARLEAAERDLQDPSVPPVERQRLLAPHLQLLAQAQERYNNLLRAAGE